jgi:hypothetical protein
MTLIGLDLNATRVRAEGGPAEAAQPLALAGNEYEQPLVISLEGRDPVVGRAGLALCRRLPHLACLDFLAALGSARTWVAGRHRLDAARALTLVFKELKAAIQARGKVARSKPSLALAVPSYLDPAQLAVLSTLVENMRWSPIGSVAAPLAAALAAFIEWPWSGNAAFVDVDDHALTLALVAEDRGYARVVGQRVLPQLNRLAWRNRLVDALSDRCIRHSRRDPRESASAEQMLYDQLDDVEEACCQGQLVEVLIQAAHWGQNLILQPREVAVFCSVFARQVLSEILELVASVPDEAQLGAVFLTAAASRLPGLQAEIEGSLGDRAPVSVLPADAVARTAHDLAARFQRGDLPAGHLDVTAALAPVASVVGDDSTSASAPPRRGAGGEGVVRMTRKRFRVFGSGS